MRRTTNLQTILFVFIVIFGTLHEIQSQDSSTRSPGDHRNRTKHHHHKRRHNGTEVVKGDRVELHDNEKYYETAYDDDDYYEDDAGNTTEAYEDEEDNKFIESGSSGIVFDHVDFVLLRLKHISMRVSSNITEILALQKKEFAINTHYKLGWNTALKWYNDTQKPIIFNNTNKDSIVRQVPEEYHIAIAAYTLGSPAMYDEFNKDTREVCSGTDIDNYQWKSYFKLLQLAIQTLGTKEARWKDNNRFLYRGAGRDFVLKEGQVLAFQHFISTSAALVSAETFAGKSLFEFQGFYNGTAMAIWDHSYFAHEKEVLFSPLQVFKVDSIHVGSHYTRYVLVKHEVSLPCDDKENEVGRTDSDSLRAYSDSVRVGPGNLAILIAFVYSAIRFY